MVSGNIYQCDVVEIHSKELEFQETGKDYKRYYVVIQMEKECASGFEPDISCACSMEGLK